MEKTGEETIFTKDDLTALVNKHKVSDVKLAAYLKFISSSFIDHNGVTYGYSVVPRNSDDELYEPRVYDCIRGHLRASNFLFKNQERAAMLNPSLRNKEGYRPFDMKSFEVDPDHVLQILRSKDLEAALVGLAFFNSKFPHHPPYIVEQVFGHQSFPKGVERWWHSNFIASRKDGSPSNLFFVEYFDRRFVTFCCILDKTSCVRGCYFCGEEVVHPDDDRVLKLESQSSDFVHRPPSVASLMSHDTIVLRDIKDIPRILG